MLLSEIIIEKIKREGPLSFHDFMEMALYYPDLGYYTSQQNKIGAKGDYFTGSTLTPVYGAMIARQLEQMWEITGRNNFTVVECGAGTGALCHNILNYLKQNEAFYERMNYCIIEKSPSMRGKEKTHLHEKVSWCDSLGDMHGITGCILSNELPDNFAVHRVEMGEELMEVFVDYKDGFVEILKPAPPAIHEYLHELKVILPKGFRTEINIEATQWITDIAFSLKQGFVITIDYGYPSEELYNERRKAGTLMCYNKHTINDNPYFGVGQQDITSHVNFSALCHWGRKSGLHCCGLTNQASFLCALGFNDYLQKTFSQGQNIAGSAMQASFLTHTLLADMGTWYKVLIQSKGLPQKELLGLCLHNPGRDLQ